MAETVRLDVWLDVACLAKTRSQAKEMCEGGKVEVNGERAKAHRALRAGDRVRISVAPGHPKEVVVRELIEVNVSKERARSLYDDVTPPPTADDLELRALRRLAPPPSPPRGAGRPEKRNRRAMERLRGR